MSLINKARTGGRWKVALALAGVVAAALAVSGCGGSSSSGASSTTTGSGSHRATTAVVSTWSAPRARTASTPGIGCRGGVCGTGSSRPLCRSTRVSPGRRTGPREARSPRTAGASTCSRTTPPTTAASLRPSHLGRGGCSGTGGFRASRSLPAVAGDRLFVSGADGELRGLATSTGKLVAAVPLGAPSTGAPAVAEGRLVVGAGAEPFLPGHLLVCIGGHRSRTRSST
jgi:hypothetical protein